MKIEENEIIKFRKDSKDLNVCEGQLVFLCNDEWSYIVAHKNVDLHLTKHYGSAWLDRGDKYIHPIVLYSKDRWNEYEATIGVGDKVYYQKLDTAMILTVNKIQDYQLFFEEIGDGPRHIIDCKKILVMPDQLEFININNVLDLVNKNWKDHVLPIEFNVPNIYIECKDIGYDQSIRDAQFIHIDKYEIDKSKPVNLYQIPKVEYTDEQVKVFLKNFGDYLLDTIRLRDIGGKVKKEIINDWFHANK